LTCQLLLQALAEECDVTLPALISKESQGDIDSWYREYLEVALGTAIQHHTGTAKAMQWVKAALGSSAAAGPVRR
jgi:hypothetical protein